MAKFTEQHKDHVEFSLGAVLLSTEDGQSGVTGMNTSRRNGTLESSLESSFEQDSHQNPVWEQVSPHLDRAGDDWDAEAASERFARWDACFISLNSSTEGTRKASLCFQHCGHKPEQIFCIHLRMSRPDKMRNDVTYYPICPRRFALCKSVDYFSVH